MNNSVPYPNRLVRKTPPECPKCSRETIAVIIGQDYQLKLLQDSELVTCYDSELDMIWVHLRGGSE